jgi:hypothetical protein
MTELTFAPAQFAPCLTVGETARTQLDVPLTQFEARATEKANLPLTSGHPMNVKQPQDRAATEASFFEGDHTVAALPG